MQKRKILLFLIAIAFILNFYSYTLSLDLPTNCSWLPWCNLAGLEKWANPENWKVEANKIFATLWLILSEWVKFVAVFAVVALMLAGLNLVIGWWLSWEEEKVSQAKKWVLWALVWVVLSISAWWIISLLNEFKIEQ